MRGKTRSRTAQKGVVAIEFAIGAFAFFMMIFYWMEISYMGFVSSLVDYAVAESSRVSRSTRSEDADYGAIFKRILDDEDSIWVKFIDEDNFVLKTNYFSSVGDVVSCSNTIDTPSCSGATSKFKKNMPIAIYSVSYPYRPLFAQLFFKDIGSVTIQREAVAIQEYERESFLD